MIGRVMTPRPLIAAHREMARRRARSNSEAGFTLIELIIVVAIMPIVIGALAAGLLSVLNLNSSVSARLTDSADAQVIAVNFQKDVQSAAMITTGSSSQAPAPCGSGFQVLGLITTVGTTEISYNAAQSFTNGSTNATYSLTRYACSLNSQNQQTPVSSNAVAHDLPASVLNPATPPVTISCAITSEACTGVAPTNAPAYALQWESTIGLTGVTFSIPNTNPEPGSKYSFKLVATPSASSSSSSLSSVTTPTPGCGFALPNTGTYASTLCFVNFANTNVGPNGTTYGDWNTQVGASTFTCTGGALPMSVPIASTPDVLSFCMSVSATNCNQPCTNSKTTNPGACGVAANSGYDDIAAVALPTYSCPPTSEAFLGNNGFYTGVPGDPALYTDGNGSTAVITLTNIQVLSTSGIAATNWLLVTGDAESTDPGESITWQSTPSASTFSLLPNSPNSPVGNACNSDPDTAPGYNAANLTGLNSNNVKCTDVDSRDKTGTVMLQVQTPQTLTITLNAAGGLQAGFLGILLP
jgi:prepilin-type N-terminal cleavage/methylation domain-containing protein